MAPTVRPGATNAPQTATPQSTARRRPVQAGVIKIPQMTATDVADYFITLAKDKDEEVNSGRLADLVYIAHGWNLAINDEALIKNQVEARKYGPAIKDLHLKGGSKKEGRSLPDYEKLLKRYRKHQGMKVAEAVFDQYRNWSSSDLSEMTRNPGTPWDIVWNQWHGKDRGLSTIPIPNELIKAHFVDLERRISNFSEAA